MFLPCLTSSDLYGLMHSLSHSYYYSLVDHEHFLGYLAISTELQLREIFQNLGRRGKTPSRDCVLLMKYFRPDPGCVSLYWAQSVVTPSLDPVLKMATNAIPKFGKTGLLLT